MTQKRFINDVSEILDTYFGYMGEDEPTEREIREKDYLLIGVARSQRDAENICEKLNEQNEELISYCNFSLHDLLDKKNKEIEQLKQAISDWKGSYDELYQDIKILENENKELKDKNSQLQETLAFRSNQLALMERLVDDLGSEEMARQMEEILND